MLKAHPLISSGLHILILFCNCRTSDEVLVKNSISRALLFGGHIVCLKISSTGIGLKDFSGVSLTSTLSVKKTTPQQTKPPRLDLIYKSVITNTKEYLINSFIHSSTWNEYSLPQNVVWALYAASFRIKYICVKFFFELNTNCSTFQM